MFSIDSYPYSHVITLVIIKGFEECLRRRRRGEKEGVGEERREERGEEKREERGEERREERGEERKEEGREERRNKKRVAVLISGSGCYVSRNNLLP